MDVYQYYPSMPHSFKHKFARLNQKPFTGLQNFFTFSLVWHEQDVLLYYLSVPFFTMHETLSLKSKTAGF